MRSLLWLVVCEQKQNKLQKYQIINDINDRREFVHCELRPIVVGKRLNNSK